MIRFIFKRIFRIDGGSENETFFTIEEKNEEIERALTSGGLAEDSYEFVKLIGAVVIKEVKDESNK